MTSRSRWLLFLVSTPLVIIAAVGGLLGATQAVPQPTPVIPPQSSPVIEWSQAVTYALGNVVMFNGSQYLSIVAANLGNFPNAAGSTFWAALTGATLSMSLIALNNYLNDGAIQRHFSADPVMQRIQPLLATEHFFED